MLATQTSETSEKGSAIWASIQGRIEKIPASTLPVELRVKLVREAIRFYPLDKVDGAVPVSNIIREFIPRDAPCNVSKESIQEVARIASLGEKEFFSLSQLSGNLYQRWEWATEDGKHKAEDTDVALLVLSREGALHTLTAHWVPHEVLDKSGMYGFPRAKEFWYDLTIMSLSDPLDDAQLGVVCSGKSWKHHVQVALLTLRNDLHQTAERLRNECNRVQRSGDEIEAWRKRVDWAELGHD